MATFNPEFWEIPTQSKYLESYPSERALWYETEEHRERRYALQDFFHGPATGHAIANDNKSFACFVFHDDGCLGLHERGLARQPCRSPFRADCQQCKQRDEREAGKAKEAELERAGRLL